MITGRLHGYEDEPDYEGRNGVEIVRVHSTAYDRAPLHRRAANYLTYLARALRRGLLAERPDIVLCMTDPPLVGDVALAVARRFRVPLVVISQDVFPEIAVELGVFGTRLLVALLRVLIRLLPPTRRSRGRDRGDDEAAARGEGSAAGAVARDSELGRHDVDRARIRGTIPGRASMVSTGASWSCTPATSGMRRTSTR